MSLLSIRQFFVAALGVTALVAHAQPVNTSSDEAKIKESRRLQTAALAKNDLDTVVKYWDPAITIRRALGHPVDGAQAARKLLEPAPNQNPATAVVYQREATSVAVSSNWPLAYEEGRWSGHVGSADSKAILAGKYAAQWVKRDGVWLIRSEVVRGNRLCGRGLQGCGPAVGVGFNRPNKNSTRDALMTPADIEHWPRSK